MSNFKGFNTIGQTKKFGLSGIELIKRDLMNAFLIREGEMPGRPDLGTTIWAYVFEPNDSGTLEQIESEVRRIVAYDPRIRLEAVEINAGFNTIVIEMHVILLPNEDSVKFSLTFDQESESISIA